MTARESFILLHVPQHFSRKVLNMRTPVMATQGTLQKSNQGCFLKVAPFQQWVHILIVVPVSSSKPAMCPRVVGVAMD